VDIAKPFAQGLLSDRRVQTPILKFVD